MTSKYSGFTLLEILIVIVIIGIASTFTFLALGDFGASRKATIEAEQLMAVIKVVQQQAVLEVDTFGLNIQEKGYTIYRFDPKKAWLPLTSRTLRAHVFSDKVKVQFATRMNARPDMPQIIINPSGDMTEFQLYFGTLKNPKTALLIGKHNGDLAVQKGGQNEN